MTMRRPSTDLQRLPSEQELAEFDAAVAAHDAAIAARGLDVWLGNEPTFTDRFSNSAEWVTGALGDDKLARAERLVARLAAERPGCAVLRCVGRQYAGEPLPRWSFGLYGRRERPGFWAGPPDPVLTQRRASNATKPIDLTEFHVRMASTLEAVGFRSRTFRGDDDWRVLIATDARRDLPDPGSAPHLLRPSIHAGPMPSGGARDDLAAEGWLLFIISTTREPATSACVDLPAIDSVSTFETVLTCIANAANACALPALVLRGFLPPVDASVCWTTVTPDPAVVEVNMAPHPDVVAYLVDNRGVYEAAARVGLAPYRLHYNGSVADSGGGGQITFGGPSPERSPFFVHSRLLPRLIRYALRHPALSYLFAHDSIGGSGQSVRPDEHGLDALTELRLALTLIDREPSASPALLWRSLAPSLTDPVGNSHRAEINVEKLWNPHQPGRGQLGLVEFRAFRMQHTPERGAALAALVRAILAMLALRDHEDEFVDWSAAPHDRFALPYYLEADLGVILDDLRAAGFALARPLAAELARDACRPWSTVDFGGFTLIIRQAIEFSLLLGDATQQAGSSRLVDASTRRIEVALRPKNGAATDGLEALRLRVEGVELPLRSETDGMGAVRLLGVRYRGFVPAPGLHPTLHAQSPLHLLLVDPTRPEALEIALHEWQPNGGAYDGLPADLAEAEARRIARCVCRSLPAKELPPPRTAPSGALSPYTFDLRYLPSPG